MQKTACRTCVCKLFFLRAQLCPGPAVQKRADRADVVVRLQYRGQMASGNVTDLRIVHEADEIRLHLPGEKVLIWQDAQDLSRKQRKLRRRHGFLVHEIGKQARNMHVLFLRVIPEDRLEHISGSGDLRRAFIADMAHTGPDEHRFELFIVAVLQIADLQLGKLRRSLHQLRRTVQRNLLIPAIPVSLAAARCQLQDDILLRLEFGVVAEPTADAEICLSLAEHRLLHVGLHLFETLAEPTFRVVEAADPAVRQNVLHLVPPRQVVDLRWDRCFYIHDFCPPFYFS